MLSFFRRFVNSKVGVIVTFIVLGIIALAFAAGDVTGLRSSDTGLMGGGGVATVGGKHITEAELKSRVGNELERIRQQNPSISTQQFVTEGGLDGTLNQLIDSLALEEFGHKQGMVVSRRLADAQIASIPSLQGPTGKFDPKIYQMLLAQRKLTDAQVHDDITRDLIVQQIASSTLRAPPSPTGMIAPYAALMLEKRAGAIGFVPSAALASTVAPSDADLQTFYQRNIARYTLPERRVLRYAIVSPATVRASSVPSDAEIAQAYQRDKAKYAASEQRTIEQVVVLDQAGANALAQKVKGGARLADAAHAAGLEASTQANVSQASYAAQAGAGAASAAFAAPRGGVIGPVRGPLGWTVAQVSAITAVPGKSLAEARAAITAELTKSKTDAALAAVHDKIDDSLASDSTFDETVADQRLTAMSTSPVIANGTDPTRADSKADPALAPIVAAGFQLQDGDPPQMAQVNADGSFALVAIGRIVPAVARPLAEVRAAVAADLSKDRARAAARKVAVGIVAAVNKGTALNQALSAAGHSLAPARPVATSRADIAANAQGAPAPLVLMFSMAKGTAKLLEAPDDSGWYVVRLDRIEAGNAAANPALVASARSAIGRTAGGEYAAQLARAVRDSVGVKIDAKAVARVRADLLGTGGGN